MGTGCGIFCGTELFRELAHYNADYQFVNVEAILTSHEVMYLAVIS